MLLQALWLHQAFCLEFLGITTFLPGLWLSSLIFFTVNVWILGVIVADVGGITGPSSKQEIATAAAATPTSADSGSESSSQKRRVVAEYIQELEELHE